MCVTSSQCSDAWSKQKKSLCSKKIFDLGVRNVVIKGGKSFSDTAAIDILYDGRGFELFEAEKIDTPYTHGAGCSFAACITAELAKGAPVSEAVSKAKELITEALRQSFKLNEFVGPLNHKAFALKWQSMIYIV